MARNERPDDSPKTKVIRWVMRLIDSGKGARDPELNKLTLGQIADQIIEAARPEPSPEERATREEALKSMMPDEYDKDDI